MGGDSGTGTDSETCGPPVNRRRTPPPQSNSTQAWCTATKAVANPLCTSHRGVAPKRGRKEGRGLLLSI